jgi:hypothetical protein
MSTTALKKGTPLAAAADDSRTLSKVWHDEKGARQTAVHRFD